MFGEQPASKAFTNIGCSVNATYDSNDIPFLNNSIPIEQIFNLTINSTITENRPKFFIIFQFSYLWYSAFAVLTVITIGSIVIYI